MEETKYDTLKLCNQLCFPLYACARKVVNRYTPLLKPLGITYTQYLVLLVLWEQGSVSVGELGKTLYLDSGTLTPMLKKMEDCGLVVRERSREDERVVIVTPTEKGKQLREKAAGIPAAMSSCVRLKRDEVEELHRILLKLLES